MWCHSYMAAGKPPIVDLLMFHNWERQARRIPSSSLLTILRSVLATIRKRGFFVADIAYFRCVSRQSLIQGQGESEMPKQRFVHLAKQIEDCSPKAVLNSKNVHICLCERVCNIDLLGIFICKVRRKPLTLLYSMERAKRFELSTLTLARLCSTPELRPQSVGEG